MSKTRKRGVKRVVVAVLTAAAAIAVTAGASASHPLPQPHHALADNGVINSRD